jgi:zinc protease
MLRPSIVVLLLCAWVAGASAAPEIRTSKLGNGLRVVLAPDPAAVGVDVSLWFDAGARYERDGSSGLAYLAERLYQRTATDPAADPRAVAIAAGGSSGSYTTSDVTCFHATVVTEALDDVLRAEAARMRAAAPSPQAFATERANAAAMRRQRLDANVAGQGLELLYATAWARHPYRRPVLGTELASIDPAACRTWLAERYTPGRAVLVLVGRFDPDQVMGLVHRHFDAIPGTAARAVAPEPLPTGEKRATRRAPSGPPMLFVGWRTKGVSDTDAAALELVARALVTGPEARLRSALVSTHGLGFSVQGSLDGRRDGSLLHTIVVVRPEADSADVERTLAAEVKAFAGAPMDSTAFEHMRKQALSETLEEWETVHGRGQLIGGAAAVAGNAATAWGRLEAMQRVTREDVQRVAAQVLVPGGRATVWVRPDPASGGGEGGRP